MNQIYQPEKYALKECQLKVESLFLNDIHKNTGAYIFPLHQHRDFLELSLILEGMELVEFTDGIYTAKAGDLIIKNAGTLHQEKAEGKENLREISIGISGVRIAGLPENALTLPNIIPVICTGCETNVLRELLLAIHRMYQSSVVAHAETIHLALQTFVSLALMTADQNGIPKKEEVRPAVSGQIAEILDYIENNFSRQISLNDIAKDFFISPYYLSRRFKAETGYSINRYIQLLRLGKAEQRLAFETMSIKEIAADCGYPNLKHFYSVFKEKTGHTPNEFRNLLNPKAAERDENQ